MRSILLTALLGVTVAAIAAAEADNSLGTWKLNIEKSKYTSAAPMPVKSLTSTREASDGGVKITSTGERADGTAISTSYSPKYDGTPASVTGSGAPFDTISIKQINASTFTDSRRKTDGSYKSTGRTVISKDGKTMTWTSKGIDGDGKPFTSVFVYEKQ